MVDSNYGSAPGQSARVVLYALAVCLVVVVALGYAAGQAGQTGADTIRTTTSPKASAFVAESQTTTKENLVFAAVVAQAIEDNDLSTAKALAVEQAANWNEQTKFGETVTDDYRLVMSAFYDIAGAAADQSALDYANKTGSPAENYAFAVALNNYANFYGTSLALTPARQTIGFHFVGQVLAATSSKTKGKTAATVSKAAAANKIAAAKKAKADADKAAKAAADALAKAEADKAAADKTAAEKAASTTQKPEWVVAFQPMENSVPAKATVEVTEQGSNALKYNQEANTAVTIPATQGSYYSFSGYRLSPFALYAVTGAPPIQAWDKTADSTHTPFTVSVQTIANWKGSQSSLVIPILDRAARKASILDKAVSIGERIGKKVIGSEVKQKVVIIGQDHGVDQTSIDEVTKEIDGIDSGDTVAQAESKPLSGYDKKDDFILALAGTPSMADGVMSITLKPYGSKDDASTYAGYNMGSVDVPATAITLDDVRMQAIGDKKYFIFQQKQPIILTVTTDKHDKGTNEAAKQAFASADGTQTTKNIKIKLRARVLIDRATNQAVMEYAYKLASFNLNTKYYPAKAYPVPEDWFATKVTKVLEVGTFKNQAAGTTDDFSNF